MNLASLVFLFKLMLIVRRASFFSFLLKWIKIFYRISIKRDILIYPITITSARKLAEKLRQWPELKLEKVILAERSFEVFRQADASFSRKKILPIIKNIFSDLKIST